MTTQIYDSVILVLIYFLVLVSFQFYSIGDFRKHLPKYRPPLVTDLTPYGRSTRKRCIVC